MTCWMVTELSGRIRAAIDHRVSVLVTGPYCIFPPEVCIRGEISLVLTDIEMPNLDGFGLVKKMKDDNRFSRLPIIALTTMAGDDDIKRGQDLGINEYLIKLDSNSLILICKFCKDSARICETETFWKMKVSG